MKKPNKINTEKLTLEEIDEMIRILWQCYKKKINNIKKFEFPSICPGCGRELNDDRKHNK